MVKKKKALHNYGKNNCCHWKWWRCYIFMVGVVAYLWSRCIIMAKKMRCTIAGITVLPLVLMTRISGAQCSYYTSCYWHPTHPEQCSRGDVIQWSMPSKLQLERMAWIASQCTGIRWHGSWMAFQYNGIGWHGSDIFTSFNNLTHWTHPMGSPFFEARLFKLKLFKIQTHSPVSYFAILNW